MSQIFLLSLSFFSDSYFLEPIHVENNYSINISVELTINCKFYCGYSYVKVWYKNLSLIYTFDKHLYMQVIFKSKRTLKEKKSAMRVTFTDHSTENFM